MAQKKISNIQVKNFVSTVWKFYKKGKRDFPWRVTRTRSVTPYKILVSEIMLQQTQTSRVVSKYELFIKKYPTLESLARATKRDILTLWSGLGYNRRALNLWKTAQVLVAEHRAQVPKEYKTLVTLPGIGPYTASALLAFAYNIPTPCIETNIRSVFIHHFFADVKKVDDKKLFPLIEQTLDVRRPREWYYALMDYGAHLKVVRGNPSQKSALYMKQASFKNSDRYIRGKIVQHLIATPHLNKRTIVSTFSKTLESKVAQMIDALTHEGFIKRKGSLYSIAD